MLPSADVPEVEARPRTLAAAVLGAEGEYAEARAARHLPGMAAACEVLAFVHALGGNDAVALALAREGLKARRRQHDILGTARALAGLGGEVVARKGLRRARDLFRMALALYRQVDEVEERCLASHAYALVLLGLDRLGEAHQVLAEALDLCADDDLAWCRWELLEADAEVFMEEGDPTRALVRLEEALLERQRQDAAGASSLRKLAMAYRAAGRTWEAGEMFRMAVEQAKQEEDGDEVQFARQQLAEIQARPEGRGRTRVPASLKLKATGRGN